MKRLSLVAIATLILTISAPNISGASEPAPQEPLDSSSFIDFLIAYKAEQTLLQQQYEAFEAAQLRAAKITTRINELKQHVDKTWYVFSGSTPGGWDCSGLVKWFYLDLEVELEHSATAQKYSGEIVDEPMPGDIVGFSHNGSENVYHNGLYVGNDLFIHSPRVGTKTRLSSVSKYAGDHSTVAFTRINF
jgi:cell wall-associated NlpC family hydrolase